VSFNYYANTEIYDLRSDTIVIKDGEGKIEDGEKSFIESYSVTDEETQGKGRELETNQIAQSNNANAADQPLSSTTPTSDLSGDYGIFNKAIDTNKFKVDIKIENNKISGSFTVLGGLLSRDYNAILKLANPIGGNADITTFKITPILASVDTNIGVFNASDDSLTVLLNTVSKSNNGELLFFVEIPEYKAFKYFSDNIKL